MQSVAVEVRPSSNWLSVAARIGWLFLIAAPLAYVAAMMNIGAIRLPYWDHVNVANYVIDYFDGKTTLASLTEAHSQARALFPRLIIIGTAALTKWDVRYEYIWLAATIYGTILLLFASMWHLSQDWSLQVRLSALVLLSVIACSPGGAMNQYWSLMIFATLHYFCAIAAMLLISLHPNSTRANIASAVLCWAGAYSMGQGLFLFPVMVLVHQLIAPRFFVPTKWSLFWLANMVVCLALYLPVPSSGGPISLQAFVGFALAYVGSPLGQLLWFPYIGAIDLDYTLVINISCGVLVIAAIAETARRALRQPMDAPALIFFSFSAYATACTLATAWGRANGAYPVQSANQSRYSIFAACFLFGLIFYYAPIVARTANRKWAARAFVLFLCLSSISYYRGVQVYQISGAQNSWLREAYSPDGAKTSLDLKSYPDAEFFAAVRTNLLRLKIGPYR
jgi:hypothetical protein